MNLILNETAIHSNINNTDNEGVNFIESLNTENAKLNFEIAEDYYFNKNDKILNNKIGVTNISYLEDVPIELGFVGGYYKNFNEKLDDNSFSIGIIARSNIVQSNLKISTKNDFVYSKIKTPKIDEIPYYLFSGAVNLSTKLGEQIYIEPSAIVGYGYNLESQLIDKENNETKINIKKTLNTLFGAGVKLGFENGQEIKYKGDISARVIKPINNKNDYVIFNKDLQTTTDNLILNYNAQLGLEIKKNHKIKAIGGKINDKYLVGLSYKYYW